MSLPSEGRNMTQEYQLGLGEFSVITERLHAIYVAVMQHRASITGKQEIALQILQKLVMHCDSMLRLSLDPHDLPNTRRAWDVSSLSALARCVIETFGAFVYITELEASDNEGQLKADLYSLHELERRAKVLAYKGSSKGVVEFMDGLAAEKRAEILANPAVAQLDSNLLGQVRSKRPEAKAKAPYMIYGPQELCRRNQINWAFYDITQIELSNHIHTHPQAVTELTLFKSGTDAGLSAMAAPLSAAKPFMARVAIACVEYFGAVVPELSEFDGKVLDYWLQQSVNGPRYVEMALDDTKLTS